MKDADLIEKFINENGGYPDGLSADEMNEYREAMAKTAAFSFYRAAKAIQEFSEKAKEVFGTWVKK